MKDEKFEDKGDVQSDVYTVNPFTDTKTFDYSQFLSNYVNENLSRNNEPREMGLAFRDLTVTGYGVGAKLNGTFGSLLLTPLNMLLGLGDIFNPPVKHILRGVTGCVKPGEMLLVLGRPGAGCTTFLKSLASYRDGFRSIEGLVIYGGLDHKVIDGPLRGDVVYSPEDDHHFPTLTVGETIAFAVAARTPSAPHRIEFEGSSSRKSYITLLREAIATVLGLRSTYNTKVGNDFIRGVSGGERKRVSIAEAFASRARISMFDNSSRGLDSSTAYEFAQALRNATDIGRVTTIASIYQAGESLAQIFDKVIVLNQGYPVYFGPLNSAADHFKSIGYLPQDRQTTADFLVACTDPRGCRLNPDFKNVPIAPEDQARAFAESNAGKTNGEEVAKYISEMQGKMHPSARKEFIGLARSERAKRVSKRTSYILSWPMQVRLALKRRALIVWGNLSIQWVLLFISILQGFLFGSVYYPLGDKSSSLFARGSVLYFAIFHNVFMSLSEITASYAQRPVVIRQRRYAMLRPSADALAVTLFDIPVRAITVTVFLVIIYFISGLEYDAGKFFTFWGVILLNTYTVVAFYRMVASYLRFEVIATMIAGLFIIDGLLYAGYSIPRPSMVVWWKWLSYCNPISFAYEICLMNELHGTEAWCDQLVPNGPGFENTNIENKSCTVAGARPGVPYVSAEEYAYESFGYTWKNAGRNAGIIAAMWVFCVIATMIGTELQIDPAAAGGIMVYRRTHGNKKRIDGMKKHGAQATDVEAQTTDSTGQPAGQSSNLAVSDKIFSWHNINYDVEVKGETRRLLDNVSGYIAPGKMTALMGESGAGKTTLLNVLAQRVNTGVVSGDVLVDGSPLPRSFQADTGYCQQQDIHLAQQTVREALQFSALLRQPRETPKRERLAYVETVIELLEMQSFSDAIVGDVGEGLNVEQRKRLTIGVELAAKPSLLLFLDEPTSGLDAQAAWSIVRLLKKLANEGQAILCTIHQPSGELFNQFDRLILLKKGGKTVYFGDIGDNAEKLMSYFEARTGERVGGNVNPAEYILDAIGAGATATTDKDWPKLFNESELAVELRTSLDEIISRRRGANENAEDSHGNSEKEFAQTVPVELYYTLKRAFLAYWRNPSYILGKLLLNIISGLFIGSSFWGVGKEVSKNAYQSQIFSIFMILCVSTPLAQQLQPVFQNLRNIYEARERSSKMYRWYVFVTSAVVAEIPWNLLGGTLQWIPWYYMTQYDFTSKKAAYSWGVCMLFQLHFQGLSQACAAVFPNATMSSMMYSVLFPQQLVYCGVVQPPRQMPDFWSSWMFYLVPFTYIVEGMMGALQHGKPLICSTDELTLITPPEGQSCEQYMGNFSTLLGSGDNHGTGYFKYAPDGAGCNFCSFRTVENYLETFGMYTTKYNRDIGILFGFVGFNYLCVFIVYYCFHTAAWKVPRSIPISHIIRRRADYSK